MKPHFLPFVFLIVLNSFSQQWQPINQRIMSRWAKKISPDNVWKEYPRPQFIRSEWKNLNGLWDYEILKSNQPKPKTFKGNILVPFCFESPLSGVGANITPSDKMWYRKKFNIPEKWRDDRVVINFEAVDHDTSIWINGIWVGSHKGGFNRFSFDITDYLVQENEQELVVSVKDATNLSPQLRGKQKYNPSGIMYTPVSGIWQTVWLEALSKEAYLKELKITADIDNDKVQILPLVNNAISPDYKVIIEVFFQNSMIAFGEAMPDKLLDLTIENPKLWSPKNPNLYDLNIKLVNPDGKTIDNVKSYFGMRKISLANHNGAKYLFLNNKPLFHYGTLDQGWWPGGLLTPPSDAAMRYDIEITKAMGFNMIRKHVKIEPDRWYYHCDKIGIMVWQDMPSGGTMGNNDKNENYQKIGSSGRRYGLDINKNSDEAIQYEKELRNMIQNHFNSPSIVMWVPFNEGWGQFDTCRINDLVRGLDPTRLINPVSGWALRSCGDIYDIHTYEVDLIRPPSLNSRDPLHLNRATVIGEFGGIGLKIENHSMKLTKKYQSATTKDDLASNYLYKFNQIIDMKKDGLSGAVYTQTTDVEGELNGLMTYDREVVKISPEFLNKIHSTLYK